jgi:hypothetical protein
MADVPQVKSAKRNDIYNVDAGFFQINDARVIVKSADCGVVCVKRVHVVQICDDLVVSRIRKIFDLNRWKVVFYARGVLNDEIC